MATDQNKKAEQQYNALPESIPTTDEAERSALSERLDKQVIEDHLSGNSNDTNTNQAEHLEEEEPGSPS